MSSSDDSLAPVPKWFNGRRSISSQIEEFYTTRQRRTADDHETKLTQQANANIQEDATRSIIQGLSHWTTDPHFRLDNRRNRGPKKPT